jgi:hypothetical protein
VAERISDAVYEATEKHRFNCECRQIANKFYGDQDGFDNWIFKVSEKRNQDAAWRLKKGVEYLWRKHDE